MSGQALIDAPASRLHPAPGWFGKVVMLGDFAHRRVSQDFIKTCDPWLSQCLSASRVQLGTAWLDTYLSGPLWRFAWAPDVVDGHWWFGVLMPSVDAVGRYFPLVVCSSHQNPPMSTDACDGLSAWFTAVCQAALGTLQPGASLQGFEADLANAPQWPAAEQVEPPVVQANGQRVRLLLRGTPSPAQWAQALAGPLFIKAYAGHSFWSPVQPAGPEDSLTVLPGLPEPDQFSRMLEGRW